MQINYNKDICWYFIFLMFLRYVYNLFPKSAQIRVCFLQIGSIFHSEILYYYICIFTPIQRMPYLLISFDNLRENAKIQCKVVSVPLHLNKNDILVM